jgi:hypothetical protein
MLKVALGGMSPDEKTRFPKLIEDWLLTKITKLEDLRNDIVHTPLLLITKSDMFTELNYKVFPNSLSARGKKLSGKDVFKEYRWCRDMAIVLRDFAETIQLVLYFHSAGKLPAGAWPHRPHLPNRGAKKPRRSAPPSRPR